MLDYRGQIKKRGGGSAPAWVKAKNQEDAEDLLYCIYGKSNVEDVREMKKLEIFPAEVFFRHGDPAPTAVWAEDRMDAQSTLRALYGRGNFQLLS